MSAFQFVVNVILSVLAVVVIGYALGFVKTDPALVTLVAVVLDLIVIFMVFSQNAALKLGVK